MGKLFISYRRKDSDFAHRLAEKLEQRIVGTVFIDRKIAKDDFVVALESEVHECNVFVLVVTENTFDPERIQKDDDWIRREITLALELKKPIVLVMREGKAPPPPNELPENIRGIVTKQGKLIYLAFFDDGIDELAQHCVSISNGGLGLQPAISDGRISDNPRISQRAIGDHNIQIGQANAPVNLNVDNTRLEALAQIEQLEQEAKQLRQFIGGLQYDLTHNQQDLPANAIVISLILGLGVIVVLFSISPILGIAGVICVGGYFLLRSPTQTTNREEQTQQLELARTKLHRITTEIAQKKKFVNLLPKDT